MHKFGKNLIFHRKIDIGQQPDATLRVLFASFSGMNKMNLQDPKE